VTRRALSTGERAGERGAIELLAARPPQSFEQGFAAGRALFEAGRRRDAAQVWGQVADRWPEHERAPAVLFNAAVAFESAEERPAALERLEALVARYPDSEMVTAALHEIALLTEHGGRLERALAATAALVARGGDLERFDALGRACQLAWILGDADVAVPTCRRAATARAKTDGVNPVWLLAGAETAEAAGRLREAERLVAEGLRAVKGNPAAAAPFWDARARLAAAQGNAATARKARSQLVRLSREAPEDVYLKNRAAEVLLSRAGALAAKAGAVSLDTRDVPALRRALESRTKAMREAEAAYQAVFEVRAAGPSARAAIGIGGLYERFCDALRAAPRLVPDEIYDEYRPLLEDMLAPLETRAVQAYELALRVGEDTPEIAEEAAAALLRLAPGRYPVGRVAALGLPWGPGAEPLRGPSDEAAARRALWERPDDLRAQLDLAALELVAGRERVARYYLDRVSASDRLGRPQGEALWLRIARVSAALDRVPLALKMLERGSAASDARGEASVLLGAAALGGLRYDAAAEAFARAAGAGAEPRCDAQLGAALAAVGVAEGDPSRYPGDGLETYLKRCPAPSSLALLWLARKRVAEGAEDDARELCRRYLTAPSPDDPTGGRAYCAAMATVDAEPGK